MSGMDEHGVHHLSRTRPAGKLLLLLLLACVSGFTYLLLTEETDGRGREENRE